MNKYFSGLIAVLFLILGGCQNNSNEVVVYTTVDQIFSEPILKDFERETGIRVRAVYDTEETKSTGVMNRLIAEKNMPQSDVFWSGDPVRNGVLQSKGITESFQSEQTGMIPAHFKEANDNWIGFSARARVLIYNKNLISAASLPTSILDIVQPQYKDKFTLANPLFGTTTFHMAAVFSLWGDQGAMQWMDGLKENGVIIASSNGDVKKRVMNGEVPFGLTDTDDAFEAMKESSDVGFIFPDQQTDGTGTLIMPNAISLIKGAPNAENAGKLINYLLSSETETKLALSCAQMPLISGTKTPENVPSLDDIVAMKVDYKKTSEKLEEIQPWLKQWLQK